MFIQKLKNILNSNTFIIILIFICLINIIYKINNVKSKYKITDKSIIGIVTNIKEKDDKVTLTIKAKENVIVYTNNLNVKLGDKLYIEGTLEQLSDNTNFNLFNYRKYMLSKNTYFSMKASNVKIIKKNKNIFYNIKNYLVDRISNLKKSEYLKTFILGNTSDIDSDILESYRTNGVSHLFSVSGMHITLLSTIILFLLNKIKKSNINYIFVCSFLIFYMFLTNFTPSVIRATFLFILLTLNKFLNLNLSTFKILIIILCMSLIINPYNIYNVGFKFSYIVSLFLIHFSKIINRFKNYISKTFMTSLISFMAGIPILINNYFSINIMTILNNILFVPIVSIIIFPFSLIILVFNKLDFIYEILINILEKLSLFIMHFKIEIILCKVNILIILVYYIIIIFVLYKIYKRKYKYIYLIVILIFIHTNINCLNSNFYVTLIDVGQGDCSLIHLPYNRGDILIDTGGSINKDYSKNIISYLKSKGIKDLDYLIFSHGDFDHMGSSLNLVDKFKINKVIFNNDSYNNLEQNLISLLNKKNIKYYNKIKNLKISKYKFQFLNTKIYNNENDNSNVIYFNFNNYKFLFMGDAEIDKENDILDKYNLSNIDFLKVGHHGSDTSSSKEFVNVIKPKYSLISVGKNNRYGHPKNSVLDTLKNSKIYRTDENGSIEIKINRNKYKIKTCKNI